MSQSDGPSAHLLTAQVQEKIQQNLIKEKKIKLMYSKHFFNQNFQQKELDLFPLFAINAYSFLGTLFLLFFQRTKKKGFLSYQS